MKQKKTLSHTGLNTRKVTQYMAREKVLKKLQTKTNKKTIEQYQTALCETREVSAELPIERFLV